MVHGVALVKCDKDGPTPNSEQPIRRTVEAWESAG